VATAAVASVEKARGRRLTSVADCVCLPTHTHTHTHTRAEAPVYCTLRSAAARLCRILSRAASLTIGNKGPIERRRRRRWRRRRRRVALMGNLHAFVEGNRSRAKGNRCNSFQYRQASSRPEFPFLPSPSPPRSFFFIVFVFLMAEVKVP